ncbi:hypothetical protein M3690_04315 [Priestia megaterium]|uniref:hypothetical protein n=1 Tax=Priestia megaterium TaxID=1404 RepID=UPI00203EB658|nr:hypothetical protein [Priestia megaterium]MCM3792516.1 hypothetical protein [Priestia megaterium]
MKRNETIQRNMEHELKQILKKVASNHGLSGFKQMDNNELEQLLRENIADFELKKEPLGERTVSWKEGGKIAGVTLSIDLSDGDILKDTF